MSGFRSFGGPSDVERLKAEIERLKSERNVKKLLKALSYKKDNILHSFIKKLSRSCERNDISFDISYAVRSFAADALADIKDTRAVFPLIAALNDSDSSVRWSAVKALGKFNDWRALEPLLHLVHGDTDKEVRGAAVEALGDTPPQSVKMFIQMLERDDSYVRASAAKVLGKLKDIRAVHPLVAALRDKEDEVTKAAAEALGKIGTPAVDALIAALKTEGTRLTAAEVLGQIGDVRAVEPLISLLKDKNTLLRETAAGALRKTGGADAEQALNQFAFAERKEQDKRKTEQEQEEQRQLQMKRKRLERVSRAQGEIRLLTAELINIGRSDGFLSLKPGGKFGEDMRHMRAREIGSQLDQIGGFELMQAVALEVTGFLDPASGRGRELEVAWNGIGGWHG